MQYVLIADTFPPEINSAAIQLTDLLECNLAKTSKIVVIVPDSGLTSPFKIIYYGNHTILRVKAPRKKGRPYVLRLLVEISLPFIFARAMSKSNLNFCNTLGIIWYSPMIFWAPLIHYLKLRYTTKSYLILRDVFPNWAVDLKILNNRVLISFFKIFAEYQYWVADRIGIQSPGNSEYFKSKRYVGKVEVLHNWLSVAPSKAVEDFDFCNTHLQGKKIFLYAGNLGVAQGINELIQVCINMKNDKEIGFAFFANGSELVLLKQVIEAEALENVLVHDAVAHTELPNIMRQCHAGLVTLDRRHKSHNIPGKFLSYLANGLPVLAHINPGNDLEDIIKTNNVGFVVTVNDAVQLEAEIKNLYRHIEQDPRIRQRCKQVCENMFAPDRAWSQICDGLSSVSSSA